MAPSLWQLLIVLAIVLLIFGTRRLRGMGGDLGSAIRSFKDSMRGGEKEGKEDIAQLSTEDSQQADNEQQRSETTEKQSGGGPGSGS